MSNCHQHRNQMNAGYRRHQGAPKNNTTIALKGKKDGDVRQPNRKPGSPLSRNQIHLKRPSALSACQWAQKPRTVRPSAYEPARPPGLWASQQKARELLSARGFRLMSSSSFGKSITGTDLGDVESDRANRWHASEKRTYEHCCVRCGSCYIVNQRRFEADRGASSQRVGGGIDVLDSADHAGFARSSTVTARPSETVSGLPPNLN